MVPPADATKSMRVVGLKPYVKVHAISISGKLCPEQRLSSNLYFFHAS